MANQRCFLFTLASIVNLLEVSATDGSAAIVEHPPGVHSGHVISHEKYQYSLDDNTDPFDTIAQDISSWLTTDNSQSFTPRKETGWPSRFCNCLENSHIAGFYQMSSFFYLMDHCNAEDGFVLRTSHLADRFTYLIRSTMACDTLKLISYCMKQEVPEALDHWEPMCQYTRLTVSGCGVDCNAASPRAGRGLHALMVATVAAYLLAVLSRV